MHRLDIPGGLCAPALVNMDEEQKRNRYKLDELECLNDLACLVVTLRETLFRIALRNNTEQAMLLALQADKTAARCLTQIAAPAASASGSPI